MGSAPLVERDSRRPLLGGQRLGIAGPRREARDPFVERDLTDLVEGAADDLGGSLVEEHEAALVVGDQGRRGQI